MILGVALYSQLGWVEDVTRHLASSVTFLDFSTLLSFGLAFGGMVTVLVGGIMFARREPFARSFAFSLVLGGSGLCLMYVLNINIHGSSAILIIVLPASVLIAGIVLVVAFATAPR